LPIFTTLGRVNVVINIMTAITRDSAIAWRGPSGVALASGDPIGDPEAWPDPSRSRLEQACPHGGNRAVPEPGEKGATIHPRGGTNALRTAGFTVRGRTTRTVRQAYRPVRASAEAP
jgi:lysyl-tRNA synthetase class 2